MRVLQCHSCVIPLDRSSVLTQSFLQHSSGFSDVCTVTFSTWYLVHHPFLLLCWMWLIHSHQALQRVPLDLKVVLIPSGLHTCSILLLIPLT